MAIEVTQTADDKIWVDNILVVRDMNNNWVAQQELSTNQRASLNSFLQTKALV